MSRRSTGASVFDGSTTRIRPRRARAPAGAPSGCAITSRIQRSSVARLGAREGTGRAREPADAARGGLRRARARASPRRGLRDVLVPLEQRGTPAGEPLRLAVELPDLARRRDRCACRGCACREARVPGEVELHDAVGGMPARYSSRIEAVVAASCTKTLFTSSRSPQSASRPHRARNSHSVIVRVREARGRRDGFSSTSGRSSTSCTRTRATTWRSVLVVGQRQQIVHVPAAPRRSSTGGPTPTPAPSRARAPSASAGSSRSIGSVEPIDNDTPCSITG